MRKRHVSDDPLSEKSGDAVLRAIEKLVGNEEFSWPQVFLQRTDCAHGDDALHAQEFHRVDVRAVINLTRQDAMTTAVPRQERHALPFQYPEYDDIRRIPVWRLHPNFARIRQSIHRVQPTPSDNADCRPSIGSPAL